MLTDWLRKLFKGILQAIGGTLARWGISANALTITGCLLNIGAALIIAQGHLRWGGVALILASAFDALDGTVARTMGQETKFGAFLDSFLDRISESAVLLGLAWYYMGLPGRTEELLAYIAVVGSLLVSYARARAEAIGVACKVGLLTRVERCGLTILALLAGYPALALWILAIGTPLTALHRVWTIYQHTRNAPLDSAG